MVVSVTVRVSFVLKLPVNVRIGFHLKTGGVLVARRVYWKLQGGQAESGARRAWDELAEATHWHRTQVPPESTFKFNDETTVTQTARAPDLPIQGSQGSIFTD